MGFIVYSWNMVIIKNISSCSKNNFFPAIKFLTNINNDEETAGNTPLWLLLFRILLVIILILAFAQPIYNAKPNFFNNNPLLLIVDNGWSSSINWEKRKENLIEYVDRAEQQKIPIIILPTAPKKKHFKREIITS